MQGKWEGYGYLSDAFFGLMLLRVILPLTSGKNNKIFGGILTWL